MTPNMPNRRLSQRRAPATAAPKTFDEMVRGAMQPKLLDVDLAQADALASTVAHMTSKEALGTDRRLEIVATLRLLIASVRAQG